MFEILQALIDLREVCDRHRGGFDWHVEDNVLHVTIPLADDDVQFVEDMRTLVGAV